MSEEHHYFYGKPILVHEEQERIQELMQHFKGKPATEELRCQIYDMLTEERAKGLFSVPFKVVLRNDTSGAYSPYIEVILDSKV